MQYTTEQGLPSNELYDITQLNNGKLFVTSDRGISLYNGTNFSTLTTYNGLSNNTNFDIYSVSDSNYFLIGYDGSLIEYNKNNSLKKITVVSNFIKENYPRSWIKAIWFDIESYYFTITNANVLLNYNLKSKKITSVNKLGNQNFKFNGKSAIIDYNHKQIYYIKSNGEYNYYLKKNVLMYFKTGNETKLDSLIIEGNVYLKQFVFDNYNKNKLYFASNIKGLFLLDLETKTKVLINPISSLSAITMDRENNIWLTSIGKGLLRVTSNPIINAIKVQNDLGTFKNLLIDKEFIYSTNSNEFLYKFKNGEEQNKVYLPQSIDFNTNITKFEKSIYSIHKLNANNFSFKDDNLQIVQSITVNNRIIYSNTYSLFSIDKFGHSKLIKTDYSKIGRILSLAYNENKLLLGTISGLYICKLGDSFISDIIKLKEGNSEMNLRINCVKEYGSGFLAGSFEKGLLYIDYNNKIYKVKIGTQNNLIIHNLDIQDNTIYLATNDGLYIVNLYPKKLIVKKFQKITVQNGLSSNFINDVKFNEPFLYLATNKGIDKLNIVDLKSITLNPLRRVDILSLNNKLFNKTKIYFKAGVRNVKITYEAVYFNRENDNSFYKYALLKEGDKDTIWNESNENEAQFINLGPLNYVFIIKCQLGNEVYGPISEVKFKILPKWYQLFWIKLLGICLLLFAVVVFIKQKIKFIKNKAETLLNFEKMELSSRENEIRALRNQMNPHFIFNSLNSIQKYMVTKDFIEVNEYISKFAILIRTSLKMSKYESTKLSDEIKFLQNYLELEQKRFPNKFTFNFDIPEEIEIDTVYFPTLILQPLLENSIKHGFKNINRQGEILVQFNIIDVFWLKVIVADNGNGFKEKKPEFSSNFESESFGLNIVKERIDLLRKKTNKQRIAFDIFDNNPGVRIEIIIPI